MQPIPMWTRQHKQTRAGRLIVPAIAILFLSYFGFHAYHGEYGIYSKYQLQARIVALQAQLKDAASDRGELERRVQLLREGTIEKDMLDEFARRELDYTRANDLVIMLPAQKGG